jgi:hypothetical protein
VETSVRGAHTSRKLEGETVATEQSPTNMHLAALKYRCSLEINNYRQKKRVMIATVWRFSSGQL